MFPDPERFDPDRYVRGEDDNPFAWIAFGGGKHKCTGNAFGLLQLKAVVAVLVREFDFRLVDPPAAYLDDYHSATVMPKGPVRVRYRKRKVEAVAPVQVERRHELRVLDPARPVHVTIDLGLCQGHSVCVSEAPDVFRINDVGDAELIELHPSPDRYPALVRAEEHCPNRAITLTQEAST